MKVNDGRHPAIQDDGYQHDETQSRQHLRAQELEGGERRRIEPFQEAALAISQHDVADAKETTEHHVHAEHAGKEPVDVADRGSRDGLALRTRIGREQQLLRDVALRRVGIHPIVIAAARIQEQVKLMSAHLADGIRSIIDGYEVDIAFVQEGVALGGELRGQYADFEERSLRAAKHDAHSDYERDRHDQREDQCAAVAHKFEVAGVPGCKQPLDHARSSEPVSSRNRSSRFGGRMRSCVNRTRASMSARKVPSRSSVVISMRSPASKSRSGNARACAGKSCRGSSSRISAKCWRSSSRGRPWAMIRPRSMIAISSQSSSASSM